MQLRGKIADKEQCLIRAAPEKCNDIVRCIHAVDPLEAFRLIIFLIECRMAGIKVIQLLYILLHLAVDRILQQFPLDRCILIPLIHLGEILSHEEEFLARMSHHKTVCRPQVRKLVLKRLSRHLIDQGTLSVNHLVV